MSKPKIFVVSQTPKGLDQILTLRPDIANQYYCAVINVADSPCATFDYQKEGIPSFWFPIKEIGAWDYYPFYGTLKVVNEYYKGDKPILIHCHAGANRSPSVAYAILLAKGYTSQEAEESLQYEGFSKIFTRNIKRNHIPDNIIDFLKKCGERYFETASLHGVLANLDGNYREWSHKKFDEQNDYTVETEDGNPVRLVYNKEKKKFILVKDEEPKEIVTPWVDPKFQRKEWYATPTVSELTKTV